MYKLVGWTFFAAIVMVALIPRDERVTVERAEAVAQDTQAVDVDAIATQGRQRSTGGTVIIERSPDSHFYANVFVNGRATRFLVDSGASDVVLTEKDADAAGIDTSGEYFGRASTANGEVRFKPVRIDRLALGSLGARDVPAAVIEDGLEVSLLGQSFLERVGKVEIEGNEMRLR